MEPSLLSIGVPTPCSCVQVYLGADEKPKHRDTVWMVLSVSSPLTLTCSLFMCRFGEDVFYVAWCITRHTEAWTTVHTWPDIKMTTQLLDASVMCAGVWWDSGKRTDLSSGGDFSPCQGETELFHLKVHVQPNAVLFVQKEKAGRVF